MSAWVLLSLAASGLVAGFVSGLVGIGGGVLIVPLLYVFYGHSAWSGVTLPADLAAVVPHATSLFVIVPTSVLGAWSYHRAGLVAWRTALPIAGFSIAAALAGSQLAAHLPGELLKLSFGALLVISGARLFPSPKGPPRGTERPHLLVGALSGAAVGLVSSLLGVGGGIVAIPILVYLVGLRLEKVAATSMAIIVFTAAAGVVGYAVGGAGVGGRPSGSLGYVHVTAALPILLGSLAAVRLGVRVNQMLDIHRLRILFGVVFLVLGARLVIQNAGVLPGLG